MPSSWTQNFYHAVFGTKGRQAMIKPDAETRLHAIIGGILRELGATPIAVNGMAEHVHFLARYPAHLSHSDMLRQVKSRSSAWMHRTFPLQSGFGWQDGYGGFTVSKSAADSVAEYIHRQKEHHAGMSFEQEYLELLRRHGIDCDPAEVFG